MDASTIRQRVAKLRNERDGLELQVMGFRRKLVEGCLRERHTECRQGNCKCTRGEPHGPFLYAAMNIGGKIKYRYVGKKEDQKIVEGLRRYKCFQSKLERIRKINNEINNLWNKLRKELLKK